MEIVNLFKMKNLLLDLLTTPDEELKAKIIIYIKQVEDEIDKISNELYKEEVKNGKMDTN